MQVSWSAPVAAVSLRCMPKCRPTTVGEAEKLQATAHDVANSENHQGLPNGLVRQCKVTLLVMARTGLAGTSLEYGKTKYHMAILRDEAKV